MHQVVSSLTLISYGIVVLSYIWARLKYFRVNSRESRIGSYIYDPLVAVQVFTTTYSFLEHQRYPLSRYLFANLAYILSFLFFWWGIRSCSRLDFAFSGSVGKLITSGPFHLVRHPFYLSYIATWAASTFLFPLIPLWITLVLLTYFYILAALREEKSILNSELGVEYKEYKKEVGMFLPKATQWKKWFSELSRIRKR